MEWNTYSMLVAILASISGSKFLAKLYEFAIVFIQIKPSLGDIPRFHSYQWLV